MTGDRLAATEPGLPSVCFFFGYTKGCLIHFKQPFVRVYGGEGGRLIAASSFC